MPTQSFEIYKILGPTFWLQIITTVMTIIGVMLSGLILGATQYDCYFAIVTVPGTIILITYFQSGLLKRGRFAGYLFTGIVVLTSTTITGVIKGLLF